MVTFFVAHGSIEGGITATRAAPSHGGTLERRVKTTAHLRIPGARHEILMERNDFRDQFWVAFDAFIQGRT